MAAVRSAVPAARAAPDSGMSGDEATVSDEDVVRAAAEAAEGLVFSRCRRSDVRDLDLTVRFSAGDLEVDVYLNAPDVAEADRIAAEAALAGRAAADELLE